MGSHLKQLAAKSPLHWSADRVQELFIGELQQRFGHHMVDERVAPWLMFWGDARGAAYTLFELVVQRTLGRL